MAVRSFQPEDAVACCAIIAAAIQTMGGLNAAARRLIATKNTPEGLRADLSEGYALVHAGPTGPCGLGMLRETELCRVYVHPDAQGRGLGRLLVGKLEDEARRRGIGAVWIHASPSSIRFWLRLGFAEEATETARRGEVEFVHVRMRKVLTE